MRLWGTVLASILVGHIVAVGLAWALLNVPESSVPMLMLSAVLVVLMAMVIGWTEVAAVLAVQPGSDWRRGATLARRRWAAVIPAATVFAALWWLTGWTGDWLTGHAGEIDAWIMFRSGRTNTAWLHRTLATVIFFTRWIVGLSLGLAALSAGAVGGVGALTGSAWLWAGLSRRVMGGVGLAFVLLILLPLRAVYWRPEALGSGAVEPVFVALKLGLILLAVHVGWTVALADAARTTISKTHAP